MGMSVENPSPKFDYDQSYTVDEFIALCVILKEEPGMPVEVIELLDSEIDWAEGLPKGSVIRWMTKEDGMIYPYRDLTLVLPDLNSGRYSLN